MASRRRFAIPTLAIFPENGFACRNITKEAGALSPLRTFSRPVRWWTNHMSEYKFSCPHCDQHIMVGEGYAGIQINCPACQKLIVVPEAPGAARPAAPAGLSIQRPAAPMQSSAAAPAARPAYTPPPGKKSGSRALRMTLIIFAIVIGCAAAGGGGWYGWKLYSKHKANIEATKANPAAQVSTPTSDSTMQALGILSKVHSAYTNLTSVRADGTFTMFLDVSNITMADVNPKMPPDSKNAKRHPPGMPRMITNTTELSIRQENTNSYYFAGEAVSKIDRLNLTNTFAFWKSDKGQFTFMDSHQKMIPPTYQQLPDMNPANNAAAQFKNMQHLFDDPANLAKIVKDLGQTDDESVNGQDCYTLTAKVLGQKIKVWVDKTSYLIPQWQITLGGAISDADVDDAFSLYASAFTNLPPAALDMFKPQVKKMTPVMTKIRGTLTFTSRNIETNPSFSADDFDYPVPPGVRLVRLPTRGTSLAVRQRNACINNLRQIDAAKQQWALENGKKTGDAVTEADIKPYIKLDADGNLPKCPAGGTYTIGKVGENPTCSIPGHELP
jgi:hypothetical protein